MCTTNEQNIKAKIGISTFHDTMNYGAMLQAVSLCRVVREAGYDCEIIDYDCQNIDKRKLPRWNYKGRIIGGGYCSILPC